MSALPPPPSGNPDGRDPGRVVDFNAATLEYDQGADIVTAAGDVRMQRDGNRLRADKVVWNRVTGRVIATGNVAITNPQGDTAFGDSIELTDSLKDGAVDNILVVLEDGGRIAARSGTRSNGRTSLSHAVYSPCSVTDRQGRVKTPLWQIKAVEVVDDPERNRIFYRNARLEIAGLPVLYLPRLSHPGGGSGSASGLLIPNFRYNRRNGGEILLPYYWKIAPNRDLTLTPHVFTRVMPALEFNYRQLTAAGPFQFGGMITQGSRLPASVNPQPGTPTQKDIRGYLAANGRFQLDPDWRITFTGRVVTDNTFLSRYDISRDDRLRSYVNAERITADSYLSVAGWAVQTLRPNDKQGQQPFALPAIDFRWRPTDPLLGGQVEAQVNSLSLIRTAGQDTQRALASVRWDLRTYTPMGQQVTFTAYGRGDIYHAQDTALNTVREYAGTEGWRGRGIAALAADMRWPFLGELLGGEQVISPRVQLVASPRTRNLSIPNEDARAIDLEDSNLFALNRFNGYDRWEDAGRVTYGLEWNYDRPRLSVATLVGQSYRLGNRSNIFPTGTGLDSRLSDIVGRTTVRYGRLLSLTHRYRVDKDSLDIRRNEIDAAVGTQQSYVTVGYTRLNRDIPRIAAVQDLGDREEIRLGARWKITRNWSVFGSTIIDLTGRGDDPLSLSDGYEPIRHRAGIAYQDECFELGVTWRRDYVQIGDARQGNTYQIHIALKNLGI